MPNRLRPTLAGWVWLALASVWFVSFFYTETALNETIWCLWRQATGLNCAGCGLTRAFCALSAGAWSQAVHAHPVGPLLYLAMCHHVITGAIRWVRRDPLSCRLPPRVTSVYWGLVATVFGLHLAQTVLSWL